MDEPSTAPTAPAKPDRASPAATLFLRAFYLGVAAVALAGQSGGAHAWLGWALLPAIGAAGLLELGGIALAAIADDRRQRGERAWPARILSAIVAAVAVTFQWLSHSDHLAGGFFAIMSALGYCVYLIDAGARRRDALRARGDLAAPTPDYGTWQWLRHPFLTRRARALAKDDPTLNRVRSLHAAAAMIRAERSRGGMAKVVGGWFSEALSPEHATLATTAYDMNQVAAIMARHVDHELLAARLAEALDPDRLAAAVGRAVDTGKPDRRPVAKPTAADRSTSGDPTTTAPADRPLGARPPVRKPTGNRTAIRLVHESTTHGAKARSDASFLRDTYGDDPTDPDFPGRNQLMRDHGGNAERWSKALRAHADRADQEEQTA